jgi:hypothetical protein
MADKINVRSPFFTRIKFDSTLYKAELKLYVYDGTRRTDKGSPVYNLSKTNTIDYTISGFSYKGISFEISELVRDYLDVAFDGGYNSYNKWVRVEQFFYTTNTITTGTTTSVSTNQLVDSVANFTLFSDFGKYVKNESSGAITLVEDVPSSTVLDLEDDIFTASGTPYTAGIIGLTDDYIAYEGYGYYKDGRNPQLSQAYLQSNKKIYRLQDHNVRIPIDTDKAVSAVFRLNGETVNSQTFTPSEESDEQVIYFNVGFSNADTYEQRVKLDGGIVETSPLLREFFGTENIGEVDEIYVNDGDKTDVIKIITEPCSKYQPYKVVFVNRFGVLQDLFFSLKSTESITTTGETYKANNFDYTGNTTDLVLGIGNKYDSNKHQIMQYSKMGKESIVLNTGYLSEDYNDVMQELMLSEQVWLMATNSEEVLPVLPKTQNITFKTSVNDKLVQYTIEFDMAFDKINSIR